jgi:O-acetyl-ADP-ribose deacetylase (regulator of RNase III)
MKIEYLNGRVQVKVGDITAEKTEAIVNAANWTLLGGGGVDGAIHSKGGSEILNECKMIRRNDLPNGLPTGEAVLTTAGNLPSKFVIHTVGPIYGHNGGRDSELLANSYKNCLRIASENNLATIAFPSISTGAFYFPKHEAAKISSVAIAEFLKVDSSIKEVHLIFFSNKDAELFVNHQEF